MKFITGKDRNQTEFFCLEQAISSDNEVCLLICLGWQNMVLTCSLSIMADRLIILQTCLNYLSLATLIASDLPDLIYTFALPGSSCKPMVPGTLRNRAKPLTGWSITKPPLVRLAPVLSAAPKIKWVDWLSVLNMPNWLRPKNNGLSSTKSNYAKSKNIRFYHPF